MSKDFRVPILTPQIGVGGAIPDSFCKQYVEGGAQAASPAIRWYSTASPTGNRVLATRGSGDTQDRFYLDYSGLIQWSSGTASGDVNLGRISADLLGTDDTFRAVDYSVGTSAFNQSMGRGIHPSYYVQSSTSVTGITTTETQDSQIGNLAFTAVANRRYRFRFITRLQVSVAATTVDLRIRDGGAGNPTSASTLLASSSAYVAAAGGAGATTFICEGCVTGLSAGTHFIGAFAVRTAGSGSITLDQPSNGRREFYVEDVGAF